MKPLVVGETVLDDGSFNVCVTLTPGSLEELEKDLDTLETESYDLIEWRADYLETSDELNSLVLRGIALIKEMISNKPLLFTFRRHLEGGRNHIRDKELYDLRKAVIMSEQVDILDVELHFFSHGQSAENLSDYQDLIKMAKSRNIFCLISWHSFKHTPEEDVMLNILSTQMRLGADICKLTTMANSISDMESVMSVSRKASRLLDVPHIALAMGDLGKVSRYSKNNAMSCITYAPLNQLTAPGQMSLKELNNKLK